MIFWLASLSEERVQEKKCWPFAMCKQNNAINRQNLSNMMLKWMFICLALSTFKNLMKQMTQSKQCIKLIWSCLPCKESNNLSIKGNKLKRHKATYTVNNIIFIILKVKLTGHCGLVWYIYVILCIFKGTNPPITMHVTLRKNLADLTTRP